ncbi:MAG: hypothetical protein A2Y20_04915 [Firmicutes bacterium GWF2_51_9]|nr:MAG: hypothetical protein A2Y20_04915 [Firmicutes bacterium GWF2_51_9]OGS57407.1 MAG: hypothetical protein A2Y19_02780 [Firmicutes bacterium GWE2_51_13]
MNDFELNIQPNASILNIFSRLNYKPWYAVAEFVDNATQSYFDHLSQLMSDESFSKLSIDIKYDENLNVLTIEDNAFGMDIEDFKRAILLDSRKENSLGRNEFGMGLKTAASWFGNRWTVESVQLGSGLRYSTTVDIDDLKSSGANSIIIHQENVNSGSHGTRVIIEKVTKKINPPRTKAKIYSLLSSMYRRDIENGEIVIRFNDDKLSFQSPEVLQDFRGKNWIQEVDFSFNFDDSTFKVNGYVGIMKKGGFQKAGFALFRRNRVVIGGEGENYKPEQIFGQAQSQVSLKLFGELNLDDFPINQSKDGFVWHNGLEDTFVDSLKETLTNNKFLEIAELSKKQRISEEETSSEISDNIQTKVQAKLDCIDLIDDEELLYEIEKETNEIGPESTQNDVTKESGVEKLSLDIETIGNIRSYETLFHTAKIAVQVQWASNTKKFWIDIKHNESMSLIDIILNIDHVFFKPYSEDPEFKELLERFSIAFALAEMDAVMSRNDDGRVFPNIIRNSMNEYLRRI